MWWAAEHRNHVVFKNGSSDVEAASDLIKFRVAWWFKHHRKGSSDPVTSLILNIKDCCKDSNRTLRNKNEAWIPYDIVSLKFNMDGAARGSLGPAGIGGVLRNSNRKVLCSFSYFVSHLCATSAEILAILKAFQLCVSQPTLSVMNILIISDSSQVVSWLNDAGFGNFSICSTLGRLGNG
ncbi:hypothetical protein QYF36_018453 [Acer negundo]|nr:hypothetical protein QYF36_018453 [Acer negundo]